MRNRQALWVALLVGLLLTIGAHASKIPQFPHLALTGSVDSMRVSWWTTSRTEVDRVFYRKQGTSKYELSIGTSSTYESSIGYNHVALLTNLQPDSLYEYYVDSDQNESRIFTFRVSPPYDKGANFSVAMFGDMGILHSAPTIQSLNRLAQSHAVDFMFHVGDISYANDRISYFYHEVYDDWFKAMNETQPYVPYMVCPGNHDEESGYPLLRYSLNFTLFNMRFDMPYEESKSTAKNNMWYSFDYRNVHFISISTECDYPGAEFDQHFGDQLQWLKDDLEKAKKNRDQVPWIVVVGHRPMYTAAKSIYSQYYTAPLRRSIEDILKTYAVDLFIVGHVHWYERTWPVYQGKVSAKSYQNPSDVVEIVTGAAGSIEGEDKGILVPLPEWSAFVETRYWGYGILQVDGPNTLIWSFYRSGTDDLLDRFTLTQQRTP